MASVQVPEKETKLVRDSYPTPSPRSLVIREVAAGISRVSRDSLNCSSQWYKVFAEIWDCFNPGHLKIFI